MDSSKLKAILIVIVATFIALYLGIGAATDQLRTIGKVLLVGGFFVCLLLGRKIWLLIPFLGALNLSLSIPGTPSTLLLAQVLVIGFSTMMLLARKLPFQLRFSELEWLIVLLVACVAQTYIRNPVGLNVFGGQQIGGKAYVLFCVAVLAAFLLCGFRVPAEQLRTALKLTVVGAMLNFVIGLVGVLVPSIGVWVGAAPAPGSNAPTQNTVVDSTRAGRIEFVRALAQTCARTVASFRHPILACFSLRWAPVVLLSLALAAVSGYRNEVGMIGLTYLVGIYYWGGGFQVVASSLVAIVGLGFLAVVNVVAPLPPNIQRSLSFLPGTWDKKYYIDTEGSTQWRVEMWEEALLTDRWIENKIMGDGLGFSRRELLLQAQLKDTNQTAATGASGLDAGREFVMINGDYHSGPVSAVRTIGYVGLIVMWIFQIRIMVRAHRQILRCRGTEWFSVVLFFCIPMIWYPIFFTFIFGGFRGDVVVILMNAGMLRLLENNLPLPAYVGRRRFTPVGIPGRMAPGTKAPA